MGFFLFLLFILCVEFFFTAAADWGARRLKFSTDAMLRVLLPGGHLVNNQRNAIQNVSANNNQSMSGISYLAFSAAIPLAGASGADKLGHAIVAPLTLGHLAAAARP